jgi:hypothetical protein
VAAELVAILEEDPREPWLLNHAGVALYELGEIRAAEPLFTAARRLDPELPDVDRNLAECARRRRAGTASPQGLPPAVLAVLRDLGPRAKRIAAAARPAGGLTLSLCMIVKDEEAMLGKCLASVRDAVDEVVVVDTGSSDPTAPGCSTTPGRATSLRRATSPSTPPPATGSSTSTPTRSWSRATPRRCAR